TLFSCAQRMTACTAATSGGVTTAAAAMWKRLRGSLSQAPILATSPTTLSPPTRAERAETISLAGRDMTNPGGTTDKRAARLSALDPMCHKQADDSSIEDARSREMT